MTIRISAIVLLLCSLGSCKKNPDNTLQVIDTKASVVTPANLSDVFHKVERITLETTSPLIHMITRVIKTKDYLFLADLQMEGARIMQFDSSGRFINQIGRTGHGPGEYFYFFDFAVDTSTKLVYVASFNQILVYDFKGKFIRMTSLNIRNSVPFLVNFMTCLQGELWSFQHRMVLPSDNNRKWVYLGEMIRYNEQLLVLDTVCILKSFLNRNQMSGPPPGVYCLSDCGEKSYVYYLITDAEPLLRDTLYELRGFRKIPSLKLDFSEILSVDMDINPDNMEPEERLDAYFKIRNIMIKNIYRTKRYVFAEYYNILDPYLFCYDLDQQKRYNMKEGFTDDISSTGIANIKPSDLLNGEFYYIKNGYELEGIFDGIGEDSNPVVFFVKTKE